MNYFIHYKLYPALAKYGITYWYIGTICGLTLCWFFWLYTVDAHLKKVVQFYEVKLVDIQKKDVELFKKRNSLAHLEEQKENLFLNFINIKKAIDAFWHQGAEIFTTYAKKNQLTIDTITITQQTTKDIYKKQIFSLTLQGSIQKILMFLEDMQKNEYLILEHFSLYVESKNSWIMNCSYIIQKIKNPSTHNKLKG